MDLTIKVAIFGLVGVIIGGFINTGTTIFLNRTRERVNRQREIRKYAVELKRASRLIDAELSRAQALAQICVEKKHWWSQDVQLVTTEAWQKFSGIVAPELSDTAWLAVRVAVEAVDNLRSARGIAIELSLTTEAIPNTTAEKIVPMLRDIEAGRSALAPFMLDALYAPGDSTKR